MEAKDEKETEYSGRSRRKGHKLAAVLRLFGTLLLILLVLICLPLTIPRLFGYHIYTVVSGSMEPAIPTGSLVYIREVLPENVAEGEVIAYYGTAESASVITHRVVENRVIMGEFLTKGDANQKADRNPVPYASLIGEVVWSIPRAGNAAALFTSPQGKAMAAAAVGIAIVLHLLASLFEKI